MPAHRVQPRATVTVSLDNGEGGTAWPSLPALSCRRLTSLSSAVSVPPLAAGNCPLFWAPRFSPRRNSSIRQLTVVGEAATEDAPALGPLIAGIISAESPTSPRRADLAPCRYDKSWSGLPAGYAPFPGGIGFSPKTNRGHSGLTRTSSRSRIASALAYSIENRALASPPSGTWFSVPGAPAKRVARG